ncbi:MAG: hypothetical protein EOP83_34625 [Verrucomicrobiaceae bacterium]|nr:MAG: hypothetical protein EOP83_34625 [Verrucomicrobiaceae bacterium]
MQGHFDYFAEKERQQASERWRREQAKLLPDLTRRVFALREVTYSGCGFHYALEASLGRLITGIMQYDSVLTVAERISLEIGIEMLIEKIGEAEASVIQTEA